MIDNLNSLDDITPKHLSNNLHLIVDSRDIDKIQRIFTHPNIEESDLFQTFLDLAFYRACYYGYIDVVRFLASSTVLKCNADLNSERGFALADACERGHSEVVKYLLTSPDIKNKYVYNIEKYKNPLYYAFVNGNATILESVLNYDSIIASISENNPLALHAVRAGNIDSIRLVFTNQLNLEKLNFKGALDIHADKDISFIRACEMSKHDMINYFVFEYNIQKTKEIEKYLLESGNDDVSRLFEKRELNIKLKNNLSSNQEHKTPKKPKL